MRRKCYISFKTEDVSFKRIIQEELDVDMIDKSLDNPINSTDIDYIMRIIREEYLSDSTVTIHLIGAYGAENRGEFEQRFIKRELQASLYHGVSNTQNGILGVVLPSMYSSVYGGTGICSSCGGTHTYVNINEATVVKEFSYNYYIPNSKCSWAEEDRYCVLARWDDFKLIPNFYIEQAFEKRCEPIAEKTRVRP